MLFNKKHEVKVWKILKIYKQTSWHFQHQSTSSTKPLCIRVRLKSNFFFITHHSFQSFSFVSRNESSFLLILIGHFYKNLH